MTRRRLRWIGILLAVGSYAAVTIYANTAGFNEIVARGREATESAMRPFYWAMYAGFALIVVSFFWPKRTPPPRESP